MGIYSSSQFLGIFIGGVLAGLCYQWGGVLSVLCMNACFAFAWFWLVSKSTPLKGYHLDQTSRLT